MCSINASETAAGGGLGIGGKRVPREATTATVLDFGLSISAAASGSGGVLLPAPLVLLPLLTAAAGSPKRKATAMHFSR